MKRGTPEWAGMVRQQPVRDAGSVEVVHAYRQHPDVVAVGHFRQAHRARRLRPPVCPPVRAQERLRRPDHLHDHRRRRRLLVLWHYSVISIGARTTTIGGVILLRLLERAEAAVECHGEQADDGQAKDDGDGNGGDLVQRRALVG